MIINSGTRRALPGTRGGFTLIELMIAVMVIALLLAIAFPAYKNYLVRTSRQQAQTLLMSLAGLEEKIFLNSSAYAVHSTAVTKPYDGSSSGGLGLSSGKTPDGKYDISIAGTSTTFVITATPVAGTSQAGDDALTINDAGARKWGSAKNW